MAGTEMDSRAPNGFAAIDTRNPPQRLRIDPRSERITSVISDRTSLRGDVDYEEGVKIDGLVQGTVRFGIDDGLGIVAKSAVIEGNLIGPKALVLGEIRGDVEISGLLVVCPGASIEGNVSYGRIIVYDGANISGNLRRISEPRNISAPPKAVEDVGIVSLRQRAVRSAAS